ncbi:helix-turn-helix domain-containing protein [Streptomyces sp. NPDC054775]
MTKPVILTVRYTPPGAPDDDALHPVLHASPGARLALQLDARSAPAPADIPAQAAPDWQAPGLPADCASGTEPHLLTDPHAHARIKYGLSQGWTQRRIGEFAGRSATVVNRVSKRK